MNYRVTLTSIYWDYSTDCPFRHTWETDTPETIKRLVTIAKETGEREVSKALAECRLNIGDTFYGSSGPIIRIFTPSIATEPAFITRHKDGWWLSGHKTGKDRRIRA